MRKMTVVHQQFQSLGMPQMLILLRVFLLCILLVVSTTVSARDIWLVVPYASWHKEDKPYNENNLGLGLQLDLNDNWSFSWVRYRNSFHRWSTGMFFQYSPFWSQFSLDGFLFKPALSPGWLGGYTPHKWEFTVLPSLDILYEKKIGFNIVTDFSEFAGFSWKYNF